MKIKTFIAVLVTFLVAIALVLQLQAGPTVEEQPVVEYEDPFLEFQVTPMASYAFDGLDAFGGGVRISTFFFEDVGIAVDYVAYDGPGDIVHDANASLIYRLTSTSIEPYVFAGGGIRAMTGTAGTWHAGGGVNFWLNDRMSIFAEGRYTWVDGAVGAPISSADFPSVSAGISISF